MGIEEYLRQRVQQKQILLMTHIVIGYPSMDASLRLVESMVEAGVDLMELQIPFSEPIADGPVILHANQKALRAGTTVAECLEFAETVCSRFDIPFLFMSYYNIPYRYGLPDFVARMREIGIQGAIVPDLPPEEAHQYLGLMQRAELDPIFIYSPNSPEERLREIAKHARGFIYCVARKGVTGADTQFSDELEQYLGRCRRATDLPLALGFGVKDRADVDFLRGKVDVAVVGSQTIRIVDEQGVEAVAGFLRGLR